MAAAVEAPSANNPTSLVDKFILARLAANFTESITVFAGLVEAKR